MLSDQTDAAFADMAAVLALRADDDEGARLALRHIFALAALSGHQYAAARVKSPRGVPSMVLNQTTPERVVGEAQVDRLAKLLGMTPGLFDQIDKKHRAIVMADALEEALRSIRIHRGDNAVAAARTAARTNIMATLNDAAMDEFERQHEDVPALRIVEIRDKRTRGNPGGLYPHQGYHFQMHGFIALINDPVWRIVRPPNGWNCRATIAPVLMSELQRIGATTTKNGVVRPNRAALRTLQKRKWDLIEQGKYPDKDFAGVRTV